MYSGTYLFLGPIKCVVIREVSSFINTSLYEVGTWLSVLIREVSFNTRRYTLVHGFCFFKLFPIGCIGLTVRTYRSVEKHALQLTRSSDTIG